MLTPESASDPRPYRTVFIASAVISICMICGTILGVYCNRIFAGLMAGHKDKLPDYYTALSTSAFILKPFTYQMSRTYWTRIWGERFNFLDYLPVLIGLLHLIGVVFFALKKNAGVRLLRFAYSVWFIFRVFALTEYLLYQAMLPLKLQYTEINRDRWYIFLLAVSIDVVWIAVSVWLLTALKKFTRIKLEGEGDAAVFVPSNRWLRFLHMQIDGWLMIFLLISFISTFLWMIHEKVGSGANVSGLQFLIFLITFVIQFLYYVLFEGIWGLTPGKCLTGSVVTNDKGLKADWGKIMSRTLSRFIPFDNFSFFSWRGWHDRLSDTWVCKEEQIQD